jgi:hypothetical protein
MIQYGVRGINYLELLYMACQVLTTKAYTERPSPPIKANDCAGKTRKGNDGTQWVSMNKGKTYRWYKKTIYPKCGRVRKGKCTGQCGQCIPYDW